MDNDLIVIHDFIDDFEHHFDFNFNLDQFVYFDFHIINDYPRIMKKPTYVPHISVYAWAAQFCYGKTVLDIGCGEGYGLLVTSFFAKKVIGLDFTPQFLRVARAHSYECVADIKQFDLEKDQINEEFDICMAFEILEHIDNPKEVCARMRDLGKTLVFSVPHNYPHRLHKTDYFSREDAEKLVPGFQVDWYYLSGTNITTEVPETINRYIGVATPI